MAGGQLNPLLHSPSRMALYNSFKPCLYNAVKRYCHGGKGGSSRLTEVKAPSIADEFERVAEERKKEAGEGVASQTAEKAYDAAEEAILGGSKVESVKDRYKQHEPGSDYTRKGENK